MVQADLFSPYADLAGKLLVHATSGSDGAHDIAHLSRVFKNAMRIQAVEGGNGRVLAAASLLHDCVAVEKNSPLRNKASTLAAEKATEILKELGWELNEVDAVAHAVGAHSFSADIEPQTIEAKILQDADRLDAIGLIGASRCFYIGGRMNSSLYDPLDPLAERRALDDKRYCIDHFETKLFKLAGGFQTDTGHRLAVVRDRRLRDFLTALLDEI